MLWFAADNLAVLRVNQVDANDFSVQPLDAKFDKERFEPGNNAKQLTQHCFHRVLIEK